jgi:hypothetical protein
MELWKHMGTVGNNRCSRLLARVLQTGSNHSKPLACQATQAKTAPQALRKHMPAGDWAPSRRASSPRHTPCPGAPAALTGRGMLQR